MTEFLLLRNLFLEKRLPPGATYSEAMNYPEYPPRHHLPETMYQHSTHPGAVGLMGGRRLSQPDDRGDAMPTYTSYNSSGPGQLQSNPMQSWTVNQGYPGPHPNTGVYPQTFNTNHDPSQHQRPGYYPEGRGFILFINNYFKIPQRVDGESYECREGAEIDDVTKNKFWGTLADVCAEINRSNYSFFMCILSSHGAQILEQKEACPVTPKRYQKCHLTRAATVSSVGWKSISFTNLLSCVMLLSCLLASCSASNSVDCLEQQYAPLTGRAVVRCDGLGDFPLIYWFDDIEDDATAFIQKENGEVTGSGYGTVDYNIDNEGSLVIYNVTLGDDRTFRVRALDSDLIESSDDVTLIVYVEPAEPLPEIPECLGQSTCILKGESDRGISCIHGQSRPAMEVSWFLRDGREDRLLDAAVNQMVSADAVTFTTSAQLEMPIDAKMNQLVVLVCKSHQSVPGMKDTERKILLDNSVDDPFTNVENLDPAYAFEREEDFKIKCQSEIDTANNVVLWMYKSLISEDFVNILYSAYGEVAFTTKGEAGFNITDDGAFVIKEVNLQHEGYYACVSSLATTFVKNLEVIVLPKPPRIVVKGCEPFQPCHLSAQEAETITCTVNGVRPRVDLSIATYSMNAAVTYSAVNSHKKDGLFYTTIEGQVDVSKVTCEENHVTVICQARGTAAYGFMSDAYIMISVDGDDCAETSTDMVNPDDRSGHPLWVTVMIIFVVVVVVLALILIPLLVCRTLNLKVDRWQCSPHHQMNSQRM